MSKQEKSFNIEVTNTHKELRDPTLQFGIYAYVWNTKDHPEHKYNDVMYVGKDSWISRGSRRSDHQAIRRIKEQKLHQSLFDNKDNLRYEVVAIVKDKHWMVDIEAAIICNFTAIGHCKWNIKDEVTNYGE